MSLKPSLEKKKRIQKIEGASGVKDTKGKLTQSINLCSRGSQGLGTQQGSCIVVT